LSGSPVAPDADPRAIPLLRVRLAAGTVTVLSVPLTVLLFLAAIFSHQAVLFSAALFALIAGMLGNTVVAVWRAWALWQLGAWMGLDGKRHTRGERPGWFWAWLVAHLLVAAVLMVTAGYLARTLYLRF